MTDGLLHDLPEGVLRLVVVLAQGCKPRPRDDHEVPKRALLSRLLQSGAGNRDDAKAIVGGS
eukprot:6546565-Alexandrium_andersonii.AAC.1